VLFLPGCRKWDCEICGPRRRWALARRIRQARPNRFLTLTTAPKGFVLLKPATKEEPAVWTAEETPRQVFDRTRRKLTTFLTYLKRKLGRLEYIRVLEQTKRGYPHYHLLLRSPWIDYDTAKAKWEQLTGAWMIDIQKIKKDERNIRYITKYLTKANHVTITKRRVTFSKNFFPKRPPREQPLLGLRHHKDGQLYVHELVEQMGLEPAKRFYWITIEQQIPEEIKEFLAFTK
jgi:hypothetical protein